MGYDFTRYNSKGDTKMTDLKCIICKGEIDIHYDDNGEIVTNIEVTRGRKIERQQLKNKVVKKKKKRKKRKSPRRKKSSRRSPIQMQEYDIRDERYKENYSKHNSK